MDDLQEADILLVNANPADAEATVRALGRADIGNDLIWIDNGDDTLEFLFGTGSREKRPAANLGLIVLEVSLPKVGGVELLRRIKAEPSTHSVPVVMLAESAEGPEIARCYQLGANSCLVKPANPEQLSELVCQAAKYWTRMNRAPRRQRQGECPMSPA